MHAFVLVPTTVCNHRTGFASGRARTSVSLSVNNAHVPETCHLFFAQLLHQSRERAAIAPLRLGDVFLSSSTNRRAILHTTSACPQNTARELLRDSRTKRSSHRAIMPRPTSGGRATATRPIPSPAEHCVPSSSPTLMTAQGGRLVQSRCNAKTHHPNFELCNNIRDLCLGSQRNPLCGTCRNRKASHTKMFGISIFKSAPLCLPLHYVIAYPPLIRSDRLPTMIPSLRLR